jgi:hypothetical protein
VWGLEKVGRRGDGERTGVLLRGTKGVEVGDRFDFSGDSIREGRSMDSDFGGLD